MAITSSFPTMTQASGLDNSLVRKALLVLAGTLALWISAKIKVPFYPVPMTMQPLVVLAIGLAYGWRLGGVTLIAYLLEGAMGLPVFAGTPEKGIGLAYMAGPTGGYLAGFVLAAMLAGWLAERGWDRSFVGTLAAATLGLFGIYLCGVVWLSSFIGLEKAFAVGVLPFLVGDALKVALAALAAPAIWRLINR